ncbi:MAG: hypothetical protein DLD55_02325 [candidate division SR1 bacterium]|nr:MAG: hypothetical protein DLD55_02325 [candidate division SR1 bacterium]
MKKIILFFAVLGLLLPSCKKEVEITPSFTYKVGIIHDASLEGKNLSLELTSSYGEIEALHFESLWAFEVEKKEIKISLSEEDFSWEIQGRTWRGNLKNSLGELLASPKVIHRNTSIRGAARIDGKWWRINHH